MDQLRKIIRESILIAENLQMADKLYFNPGKLSPEAKKYILHITGGDAWTKLICDIYYAMVVQSKKSTAWILSHMPGDEDTEEEIAPDGQADVLGLEDWKKVRRFHNQLKAYNKNLFPIEGFNANGVQDIWAFIRALNEREKIVEDIAKLPSIARRNMKEDFRQVRNSSELQAYRNGLESFLSHYSLLSNRDEKMKATIEKKMFKAGITLNDLLNFVEEKQNLLGGAKFTKNSVKKIIDNNYHNELEVIYEKGNIMVIEVAGPQGIKDIGCNSVWCFTYGSGFDGAWRNWNNYSTNGFVYVIIDFSEPADSEDFMHVVIKPINYNPQEEDDNDSVLYNMANEESYNVLGTIDHLIGIDNAKKLLTFGEEPEPEPEEPGSNSEWPYKDPNQLKLDLQETRRLIRNQFLNEAKSNKFLEKIKDLMSEAKKSKFAKLEDNKVPLTDEERKKVMDADAIWHHGPDGAPSPAVWKSVDKKTGKTTYVTNTHRAFQSRPTLKGAISIYHSFIKGTA